MSGQRYDYSVKAINNLLEATGQREAGHLAHPQSDAKNAPSISQVHVNVTSPDLDFLGGSAA